MATKASVDHPYLVAKGVKTHGIREDNDGKALIIPYFDMDQNLHTVQTIVPEADADGTFTFVKRFQGKGRKKGNFFAIGGTPQWNIVIAEGFATAATIYEVTGIPSVDAGGRTNLLPVARLFRSTYPMIGIIIAADDDQAKALGTNKPNGGLDAAREAAVAVGGRIAIPSFGDWKPSTRRTDFNDMRRVMGSKAVKAAIAAATVVVPPGGYELSSVDARAFIRLPIPPREMLMAPWLPAGGLTLIHGSREVGKTHFEVGLIVGLVTCQGFLCWKVARPVSALLVDGEMPQADLQGRIKLALRSAASKQVAPWRILTPDMQPQGVPELSNPLWREAIEREAAGCEVIVLDSVSTLLRGPESMNDATSWTAIQDWMLHMRKKGHAIIWMHHDGKGGQQLGTITRETVLDASLQLTRTRRLENGIGFKVAFTKQRGFFGRDAEPVYATFETLPDGTQRWRWTRDKKQHTHGVAPGRDGEQKKVLGLHRDGKSVTEIEKSTGLAASTIRRWIGKATSVKK